MPSLIYEGIFESFPDVKVVIVHGGGYLPHYTAPLDRNVTAHPISAKNLKHVPTDYLKCFYYDSCVYSPVLLEALIRGVGADRIILGTDYPFGEDDPMGIIRKVAGISREDVDKIISRTPAAILGLAI